ncbi:MAG: hypothetical protein H0T89_29740 [Deltaproteobacteria bacterium]|nr:hypothetical protein [Deltaproteobacteria bacterium]MDQ3297837.1 hypothetical protein [Myxococcota bacterium]
MDRWLVVVAALAGCGDNSSGRPETAGIRDGTRLVARLRIADGASVFSGWHDTVREVDCQFQPASDGEYRCLPTGLDVSFANYRYADAACTQQVVFGTRCHPPRYAFGPEMATARCNKPSGRAVFSVGAALTSRNVFSYEDGVCSPSSVPEGDAAYDLGDKLPATDFVSAQLGPTTSDPLAPYAFTAEDGAIEAVTTWDAARGGECDVRDRIDQPRCVPIEIALHYDHVWADAACTIQAAVDLSPVRPCTRPTAIAGFGSDGFNFREIGASVPVADVHVTDMANVCKPADRTNTAEGDDYYLEGPIIPDDQFPLLTRVLDGTGRLRAERYTDAAGNQLAAARGFYDTLTENRCSPNRFPDGTLRCVPHNAGYASAPRSGGYFADAACTQPVGIEQATSPPPSAIVVAHASRDACDAVLYDAVHAAGPPHTGAVFLGVECAPAVRDPNLTYYTLGAPIELPQITER